ncbi:hypothetical protein T4B_15550 [Trichinella pseudospiralis]|uniref:Uncharacterized protein n=2 Tax=Trichinella pseudospiralis TaxID=6337 RepID=A0A0V1ID84_TRIPS|nr:hypothetical protein T4B_15550 [Trichinella pseudospiralis]KRZ38751.1 hypothetical protein T4C_1038 [Trichinella pseudospiralis]
MIVIEALLFQLHPADVLKKHAWLNLHFPDRMHVVDTRSQIINSQNRLLPICQAFESAARNGVPAPVDPLPCQIVAKNSQTCALSFPREARRPQRPLGTQFSNEMS